MRIAFVGPCSTGKTTMAKHFSEKLNLPLIEEVFRNSAKGLGVKSLSDNNEHVLLQACQYHALLEQVIRENALDAFVSDRSIYCMMFYAARLFKKYGDPASLYASMALSTQRRPYDLLVYCPPFGPATDDGFRTIGHSAEAREDENKEYLSSLKWFGADSVSPIHHVKAITLEDRIAEIQGVIDGSKP